MPSKRVVKKQLSTVEPSAHRLPCLVMWGITVLTALIMAILNFMTIWLVRFLVEWKFDTMQAVVDSAGVTMGVLALVAICSGFATLATCLIHCTSPSAGGSGAPENKGWLNGSKLPGFFTLQNLLVRACAVLLANASGYPVGREGPSVTMGSNVAFLVTRALALPWVRQWVDLDTNRPALVVDEDRLAHAQRVAGAVGGACAMAMIFDAPIGGVLYMFEEITVASWPVELTFRAFVGTMICTMLSYFLLDLCGTSIRAFVLYDWNPESNSWTWADVPFFVLVAAILGPFSALHTKLALDVGALRQRVHGHLARYQPYAKMIEAVLFAAFCALVCALVSWLAYCDTEYTEQPFVSKSYVRFRCEEGAYNPVASLLLTTSEGAVRRLFSRKNSGDIYANNTFLAFLAYTFLNVSLTGIPVPSGNFTGTMLIGGLVGRFVGSVSQGTGLNLAVPGVYAMVGSAAMLSGFKQISMGVVVFIVEAANDLSLTPPLMLSVTISLLLNRMFLKNGFDEEQILRKNIPFLPLELPLRMERKIAAELCDALPPEALLPPEAPLWAVHRALEQKDVMDFPILNAVDAKKICVGFTTRDRLEAALNSSEKKSRSRAMTEPTGASGGNQRQMRRALTHQDAEAGVLDRARLPVARLADPVPYMILEDTPASLFYALFTKARASVACVVSDSGEFRGVISRLGLIGAVRRIEEAEDSESDIEDQSFATNT